MPGKRRPSPAMIVALCALFVSLAGNAGAAAYLVTSKDIKDGTIRVSDLSWSARVHLRGNRGPAGPPGPAGLPGSQGLTGPAGAPGQSFPKYTIETDLRKLCRAVGELQQDVGSSYYLNDFRYSLCSYYY